MQFNETVNKSGLIQSCEMKLFGDDGYGQISDNTNRLLQFTERLNRALDDFTALAMTADGKWQWDDNNNTDFNIATTNIISGQRTYVFGLDQLQIEMILVKNPSGLWTTIRPISEDENSVFENNTGNTGIPDSYDKRGRALIFNVVPNYDSALGLKIYFKRGPVPFISTDTTKVPGIPSIFHKYLPLNASAKYAIERQMPVGLNLFELLKKEETAIVDFLADREIDEDRKLENEPVEYM